jgi:hypothetical protein
VNYITLVLGKGNLAPPPLADSPLLTEAVHLSPFEYKTFKVLRLGPLPKLTSLEKAEKGEEKWSKLTPDLH